MAGDEPQAGVRDTSVGFWRRIHLIPFTRSFAANPDLELKDKLRAEAPGILARAVRGCLAWQRDGLNPPDVVRNATATYRADSMPLARFLEARCVVQKGATATSGGLWAAYERWCNDTSATRHGSPGHSFVRRSMSSSRRIRARRNA